MGPITSWQLLLVLLICAIVLGNGRSRSHFERLRRELGNVFPVFSAETTKSTEAEYIKERLPGRFPVLVVVAAVAVCGLVLWLWQ